MIQYNIKIFFLFNIVYVLTSHLANSSSADSLLSVLDNTIQNQQLFIGEKNKRIEALDQKSNDTYDLVRTYSIYNDLYEEFNSYQFDSAFSYAVKQLEIAHQLDDDMKKDQAKLNITFVLRSAGMYKEAFDSLNTINSRHLNSMLALDYYQQLATIYFDLSTYKIDNYFRKLNLELSQIYIDSALHHCNVESIQYYQLMGLKAYANAADRDESVLEIFEILLNDFEIDEHQFAMAAYEMGKIYEAIDEEDKYLEMIIRSAIADIRSCTKETMATYELARYMYQKGDVERASRYIRQAANDAKFYGANHRIVLVSTILPVIESTMLTNAQYKSKRLINFLFAVVLISVLVIVFTIILYKQKSRLKTTQQNLSIANLKLQELNDKLQEANTIKEKYIGYSFTKDSEYLSKMEKLKKSISKNLESNKLDQIKYIIKQFDTHKEKEGLYQKFDEVFLKLFPKFIKTFNSFFKEEDQFETRENQPLPTELRIFALIRIGITEHEQIASILGYSVRTIYNYKNKIKGMSVLPNDVFEAELMKIKTFE